MIQIGNVHLDAPFFQAGLAGYSDTAMRLIARRHGCPYAVSEAMLDRTLLNGGKGLRAAALHAEDHPIAGQLMGCEPEDMARASLLLVELGYDVVDVNLACPVKKIRKKRRGGYLLEDPTQAIAILAAVRERVPAIVPCTVKLRIGADESTEGRAKFLTVMEAVQSLGYATATIHGRTVEQKYTGKANWDLLRQLVEIYQTPQFNVFGSGDVFTAEDAVRMLSVTGVRAVSLARGAIGNPWIFHQVRMLLTGAEPAPPTIEQQRAVLLGHFEIVVRLRGTRHAAILMRKFGIRFARHHPRHREVSGAFIAASSVQEWHDVLDKFYSTQEPVSAVATVADARADLVGLASCASS